MKKILQYLFEHKTLTREAAKEVLVNIGKGIYNEHEVTAFMTVYLMRSITIEELQGFRDALLELCVKVDLSEYETMDIVGTGETERILLIFPHWLVLLWQVRDKKWPSMETMALLPSAGHRM